MVKSQPLRANSWADMTLQNKTSFLPGNHLTHMENIPQLPFTSPCITLFHPVFLCPLKALAFSMKSKARLFTNETRDSQALV